MRLALSSFSLSSHSIAKNKMKFQSKRLFLFIGGAVIAGLAYLLGWSSFFVVEKITIQTESNEIATELSKKLNEPPAVVKIGDPMARVDRREIASRLRTLLWIENVELDRRLLTGEVKIKIIPRNPLGKLTSQTSSASQSIGFIGKDLEIFYLPRIAVDQAVANGESDWGKIPEITFQGELQGDPRSVSNEILKSISTLISTLQQKGYNVSQVVAKSSTELSSAISVVDAKSEKKMDIYWGSVNELPLKIEVLQRLLELKENKRASYFNLANPVSPIVK